MVDKDSLKMKYHKLGRKYKWLTLVIFICVLQITFNRNVNASPLTHRIAGYTQYDTSSDIAKEGWSQSDYAILAYGDNFPDALAAAPLAKKYNAPILLTKAQNLTPITKQTLQDLKVKSVYLVGGTAVVSLTVENQVKDLGINVTRLAGGDRYDTAIEIAKQLGDVQELSVVSGDDYADALSISPIAAQKNAPIILVPRDHLTNSIKNYLSSNNISHTYLIGTTEQINESVSTQFPNVERITGSDKYLRNVAVLNRFNSNFDSTKIFLATGNGFADALAGSAYAAAQTAPILLVDYDYNQTTGDYLNSKSSIITQINILGGDVIMPSALVQKYLYPSSQETLQGLSYTASEIAKKFNPSIVNIEVSDSNGIPIASGSGYIIDSTGKIATNYHLIKDAYSANVKTKDGKIFDVLKVLAYDSKQDLALLKIDATGLQPVTLGDSDKIGTGDKIYTIGNPSGKDDTMSDGIISTKSEVIDGASYIQISASISSGTSGGVLVNEQAEVIGTTTVDMAGGQNLYLSTPINLLKPMLTQDINQTLAQLPRESSPTPEQTKKTDQEFAAYLNSQYGVMPIAGKSVRFTWKVNDYKSGVSDISFHGMMNSADYGNWIQIINANARADIMLYFAQINNDIAENYPGKSFSGSVLYQDYYPYFASPQFPPNDVTFAGDGKWLVKHTIVSFYDLYKLNTSEPRVNVAD
ncbi:cell wall-binding repeat-containing protein [Desulfosporosinus metallidurans]|uniref:N-acetylmuramoyl-L-alanine amidase n=1 Tax=Desulfosporosinus metallidurans TaxID=1888891 RepID=A0A1Q8QY55_9FIRM|nr:cell wall-binding repeat-containing protein [Desulfosporosinus metallidurans]OLN32170.1 N-acetylmuramoyl-L-alanine amidase [Desulfosporosinus metallidurans]